MRSRVTLYHFVVMHVCVCLYLYVCPFRSGLFRAYWIRVFCFLSIFYQFMLVSAVRVLFVFLSISTGPLKVHLS